LAESRRTLDLLWFRSTPAQPGKRGRKPGLTVDMVIHTSLRLADADGLDAVTMRQVARTLDVVPMTLYTYVPDKAALLDLMLDHLHLSMPRVDVADRPWRDRLTVVAEANRTLYRHHPWAAEVTRRRPPLGPGLIAKHDHELQAFDGTGLDEVETGAALTYLLGFVQAAARAEDPDHAYGFGLQRVLDGLGVLIDAKAAPHRDARQ
jgi:AcrR family transcriptional regulator